MGREDDPVDVMDELCLFGGLVNEQGESLFLISVETQVESRQVDVLVDLNQSRVTWRAILAA